ncbi:MAG: TMEM43 family protein [Prevotella sp.]|nr:TMEM43 family protein [Prevotella sp.]
MAYQETTTRSYGQRVGSSFKGIGGGFILFCIGTALLWWNEGRAVKTDKMLNEAEKVAVEMESVNKINPEYDGELIHASAVATTQDSLVDKEYGLGERAIGLQRTVEYYQWVEHASSESHDKLGGKQETVTTYTYTMEWVSRPVQSSTFHDPAYQQKNYVLTTAENATQWAENVTFGAYKLNESQIHSIRSMEPVVVSLADNQLKAWDKACRDIHVRYNGPLPTAQQVVQNVVNTVVGDSTLAAIPDSVKTIVPDSVPQENKKDYDFVHQAGNILYFGQSPTSPQVGDVRITFEKVVPAMITIMAKVSGDTFKSYKAKNGKTFSVVRMGKQDMDEIFESEHSQNHLFLWVLRILGVILVITGLKGIFDILSTVLKVVPFVANIVGWGVGVVCTVVGIVWSLIIIAIAWLFYRPIIGIILLAIAAFLIWVFAFKGKDKLKELARKRDLQPEIQQV